MRLQTADGGIASAMHFLAPGKSSDDATVMRLFGNGEVRSLGLGSVGVKVLSENIWALGFSFRFVVF